MQAPNKENPEKLEAFAARLSQLAGRARLKQVQIARFLGVKPQRVGSWFQGKNFPGGDVGLALAQMLGVSASWLLDGVDNPEKTENPFAVGEEPIRPAPSPLEARARMLFEDVIHSAAQDPARLGWIVEQLRLHLRPPGHWVSSSVSSSTITPAENDVLRDLRFAQLKREAGQNDFAKNGPITGQPPAQKKDQRPAASS